MDSFVRRRAVSSAGNIREIPVLELEQAIFEALKGQVERLICPDGILDPAAASIERASEYEQQLSDLQGQKMRLYEQYVSNELDADGYKRKKTVVDALFLRTKNFYAAVIAQAKKEQVQHEEQIQRNQIVREFSSADGLTQGLADLLIDRVYVYPDRRVEISYKVKDIFLGVYSLKTLVQFTGALHRHRRPIVLLVVVCPVPQRHLLLPELC